MKISAKVIRDSIYIEGSRLTTFQLCYPRFIHSEVMTHRVFSRNASSSRAIPVAKMIEQARATPAMPVHWGKNMPGMQAREELFGSERDHAIELWLEAAQRAADVAEAMNNSGLHKQVVNRLLEPFQWIHVILTATEFDNFFELRAHEDAQPEIRVLAEEMLKAMDSSIPKVLQHGEWHLPYILQDDYMDIETAKKCSAARCARVSYLTHDGKTPSKEKDIELFERLVGSRPIHASPTEHQATPLMSANQWSGNFRGWRQFRKEIESSFNS